MGYVKEIHVPSILKSDIYSLVENKFPEMDNVFKNQLTNVVCRYADGNTLSAIFAVHEATQCNDIVALEQRLTDRKLSGNIQEYYKAIWDSAKAKFQIPFVDYKMAGVFAFFNEPLNEYKLQKIFSEEGISISVWRNVLKSMRPLLVETNGNYTILHNDIRVYLSRIIGRDNDWIEEVYSFLASYYINLSEEEKGYSYYNDVLRFLIYAKRASEFKNIFTPDFIISSFVYGIGINEIYSRANDFLKRTIDENVIDWEQMKCLAFGYLTIDQIEKSQNEIEGANFRTTNQYIPVNSYECYVKPLASWNSEIITSVLSLASDLIDNNHADRAEALLYNWFYDVTLEQIYDCVKVNDGNDDGWLSPEYRNIGNLIGKTACATQSTFLLKNLSELCEKSRSFTGAVCDSAMRSAFKYLVGNDLYSTLADIELILLDTLVEEIKLLLSSNRINDLRQTEIIFREKLQKKPAGLLISLFVQIITDNICFSIEQHKSFLEQINTIELPNTMVENLIHDILFEGVDDTETVLAGGIIDYTHKEEIFGFMVSYFSIPGLPSKYAAYCYERNSRLLLQSRPDFSEQEHYNITLHHNGIESFQGSNIMCGFSKISLDEFHWHINITVNGMRLFNEGGQEIGRFEYYYGQRGNMGNRYISNQPLLQRWVVSNDAVSKARCIVGCPNNIKINHAFDSVIRKYED